MRPLIFFLMLVCLSSSAFAQVVPLRVTISECDLNNCRNFISSASAVHIGRIQTNTHIFLTAAHVLGPLSPNAIQMELGEIHVRVENEWLPATLIRSTKTDGIDLALLKVQAPLSQLRCLPLLEIPLQENDTVYLAGYPEGKEIRVIAGRVITTNFNNYPLAIDQRPIEGESGGRGRNQWRVGGNYQRLPEREEPHLLLHQRGVHSTVSPKQSERYSSLLSREIIEKHFF